MNKSTFYKNGLSVEIYDVVFNEDFTQNLGDAEFYAEFAHKNNLIIELGSGTGRISFRLAKKGYNIIGIENSDAMMSTAVSKRKTNSTNLNFVKADMCTFKVDKFAELILIPFRSFEMLLTTKDQKMCLENVHKHLRKNGKLIIHITNPDFINTKHGKQQPDGRWNNEVILPDSGNIIKLRTEMIENDSKKQLCKESWVFEEYTHENKILREEKRKIIWRWTYPEEMQNLLDDCGFRIIKTHSNFKDKETKKGYQQIIVAEIKA